MKKHMITDIIGRLLVFLVGLFMGYQLYKEFAMFWVFRFWIEPNTTCYRVITYSAVALTEMLCIMALCKLFYKVVPKILKYITSMIYVPFVILCWIGPNQMDYRYQATEWNPFDAMCKLWLYGKADFMGLEILMFVPLGFMIGHKFGPRKAIVGFALFSITIEILQSLISTAPFRTLDCFLYFVGLMLGYFITRLKKKDK